MSDKGTSVDASESTSDGLDAMSMDVHKKIDIRFSVCRYIGAAQRFEEASAAFNASCQELRRLLGKNAKFVLDSDYKTYLIQSDDQGNFEVEKVESL